MDKHGLAEELRARQRRTQAVNEERMRKELGATDQDIMLFRRKLAEITDDEIIDSYITCPDCGERRIDDDQTLTYIIEHSKDSDDFLEKAQAFAEHKIKYSRGRNQVSNHRHADHRGTHHHDR
ncbi:MAG: hypothetical protein HRF40_15195 [Nitrososphaera sp.]|jgi:hypothetical protein